MGSSFEDMQSGKVVGFLLDYLRGFHQEVVWRELVERMHAEGTSLVSFVGQAFLRGPHNEPDIAATNQIFRQALVPWVKGYFLSGENMGFSLSKTELAEYLRPFQTKPCISIGPCAVEMPVVAVESRSGIKETVRHLVQDHGRKKIAFISGMEASIDAQERLAAYREGLLEAGLPYLPEYTLWGDYWLTSGQKGVKIFLDERRLQVDAIMAANDYMALGAQRELIRRGLRVPQDVSVTGFDDVLEAEHENPALTTVRWPLFEQAAEAFKQMQSALKGRSPDRKVVLGSVMVPRRSCGCESLCMERAALLEPPASNPTGPGSPFTAQTADGQTILAEAASGGGTPSRAASQAAPLITKALGSARSGNLDAFLDAMESAVYEGMGAGDALETWQDVLSVLRSRLLPQLKEASAVQAMESALGKLRILVGTLALNRLKLEDSRAASFNENLSAALKEFSGAANLQDLGNRLRDRLQTLGIESFYLAIRTDARPDCGPELPPDAQFRFHAAFQGKTDLLAQRPGLTSPGSAFLPQDILPRRVYHLIAMPVTFGNNFYGIAAYEPGPGDSGIYVRIQDQIGTTVRAILLLEARRLAEEAKEARTAQIVALAKPISAAVLELARTTSSEVATVQSAGDAARKMRQNILDTQLEITRTAERAGQINDYIHVIEDISATISLLGLNAAIEAAHVGHAGGGFNVIASEIRKLAESTQKNAESIGSSLGELSKESGRSVQSVQRSSEAFLVLDTELERVLKALRSIAQSLKDLSESSEKLMNSIQSRQD